MVHAYLMYGFPTETAQETVDALERVRQLFAEGCIQSAFWHRFAATAHSPIGRAPERLRHPARARRPCRSTFARNELAVRRSDRLRSRASSAPGCARRSTTTCTASGSTQDVRSWFAPEAAATTAARGRGRRKARPAIPKPRVPADLIRRALAAAD